MCALVVVTLLTPLALCSSPGSRFNASCDRGTTLLSYYQNEQYNQTKIVCSLNHRGCLFTSAALCNTDQKSSNV